MQKKSLLVLLLFLFLSAGCFSQAMPSQTDKIPELITSISLDLSLLKTSIANYKTQISNLKQVIALSQKDLTESKEELTAQKALLTDLENKLTQTQTQYNELSQTLNSLNEQLQSSLRMNKIKNYVIGVLAISVATETIIILLD